MIELECADCIGPVYKGIKLVFPISASTSASLFNGKPIEIKIPLLEGNGWLKDPQNTLLKWTPPTKCDLIQVLSRLTSFKILGDWTTWYETVSVDNIQFMNVESNI